MRPLGVTGRPGGLAVLAAVLAPANGFADSAPPKWTRYVTVTIVVEAAEPFPDYAFFWVDRTIPSSDRRGGRTTVEVVGGRADTTVLQRHRITVAEFTPAPDRPARFPGDFHGGPTMYAVPKAELGRYPEREELVTAVDRGQVPGASQEHPYGVSDKHPVDGPTRVEVRYRVERSSAGTGLVFTRLSGPAGDREGSGWLGPDGEGGVRLMVAGTAIAAAVALLGVYWVSRRRARKAT